MYGLGTYKTHMEFIPWYLLSYLSWYFWIFYIWSICTFASTTMTNFLLYILYNSRTVKNLMICHLCYIHYWMKVCTWYQFNNYFWTVNRMIVLSSHIIKLKFLFFSPQKYSLLDLLVLYFAIRLVPSEDVPFTLVLWYVAKTLNLL